MDETLEGNSSIAVVIPCYDLGGTVEEAVDSVLIQSRAAAEIVVVDDGSTDVLTRQVLARLDRPRTKVITVPHGGVAAARNAGAAHTAAPYLLFLDADDVLAPSCLERFGERLDTTADLDFVSGSLQAFEGANYVWKPPSVTTVGTLTRGSVHIASMLRRRVWDAVGGFDLELPAYEDLDFWLIALEQGFKGEILDEVLLYYRVRGTSRYRRALEPDTYHRTMHRLIERHRGVLDAHGTAVLREKESFLEEILRHSSHLTETKRGMQREVEDLDHRIRLARQALAAAGGSHSTAAPSPDAVGRDGGLERRVEAFLNSRRWLLRGAIALLTDAAWPIEGVHVARWDDPARVLDACRLPLDRAATLSETSLDCVVVVDVEPRASLDEVLRQAARALKPNGTLLLVTAALSTGPSASWVRERLAGVFPLDAFDVEEHEGGFATAWVQTPRTAWMPRRRSTALPGVPPPTGGLVLAYHRVATLVPDTHRLSVSAEAFRQQMRFLRAHATVMPLLDLFLAAREGVLPPRAVAVTFDDGYLDALTTAAPILEAERIPATFFVGTERLDVEHEAWHDEVERILLGVRELPPVVDLPVGQAVVRLDTSTMASRKQSLMTWHGAMLAASVDVRDRALESLRQVPGASLAPRPERRLLTAEEVRRLAQFPGIEIGSHSVHHLLLPRHGADVQRQELTDAKGTLEALLARPVTSLAYPFGEHDETLEEVARHTPHLLAVTVEPGLVTASTDPMRLPRVEVRSNDLADFAALVGGAFGEDVQQTDTLSVPRGRDAIDRQWQDNDDRSRREYAAGAVTLSARPQFFIIDPTSRCNARCVMCPVSFRAPGDLGVDLSRTVVDKLAPVLPAASHVNLFSSGEPTIAKNLPVMIGEVRTHTPDRTTIWLSTNGKRLSAELVEALLDPRFGLQFSVDGGTKEVFEAIRRGIRFEELCASLELARTIRAGRPYPEFSFSTTLSKRNIHDLANIFELAQKYEVGQVLFYEEDPEVPEEEAFALDETDRAVFEQQLPRIERTGIRYSNGLYFRGANGLRAIEPPPPADPPRIQCAAPWKVFHQRADGTVRTCCTLRTSMGDLRHQTFEEVWNGEEYVRLRRAFVTQEGIPGTCYRCTDPLRSFGTG